MHKTDKGCEIVVFRRYMMCFPLHLKVDKPVYCSILTILKCMVNCIFYLHLALLFCSCPWPHWKIPLAVFWVTTRRLRTTALCLCLWGKLKEAGPAVCRIYYKQTSLITRCITVVVWGKSLISKTGLFSFFSLSHPLSANSFLKNVSVFRRWWHTCTWGPQSPNHHQNRWVHIGTRTVNRTWMVNELSKHGWRMRGEWDL